ncbi:uncharacterized protein BDR25DRAFT_294701 [Lindgomyces ingoldianus]|uniref:Uncharacterized protein n=1 Tax=Lindgomyces ingoldianus TaxID=673940 RepID=A0ACB6QGJ5_9PLEO|nr:uncharacterized protein BDR25DRAFT_294701 [Lindgomyces ingoldianus]KAF2465683.1 hypothetical protein BDR25DRAFT_294701 [Lindgomyces ingoldianus]
MTDPKSLEKLRPCGRLETHSTVRHDLGLYNNVACAAYYSPPNPVQPAPLEPLIHSALGKVIFSHPILSAIPLNENTSSPYFARLPTIDLRKCVFFVKRKTGFHKGGDDAELDSIIAEQHNQNFKSELGSLPFWRLVVLTNSPPATKNQFAATWIFHHALADGASGLAFHRAFLAALQSLSSTPPPGMSESGAAESAIINTPTTPLLPPLESLHPLPLSIPFLLKAQWTDWFPSRPTTLWTAKPITSDPASRETKFRSNTLSQQATTRLVQVSRENKTSVTATLECLVAAAIFSHLPGAEEGGGVDRVTACGATSLRRFLLKEMVSDESLGCWVSRYGFEHRRTRKGDPFSWAEARKVRQTINKELDKKGKDSTVGLLRWVPDLHKFFLGKMGKERGDSFELSNVGVFKASRMVEGEGCWRVGKVVFSQSGNVVGAGFEVSVVTGGDGCLVLGIAWLEGVVEGSWIEMVIGSLRAGIEELTKA